jgi:hypothetical protein
MNSGCAVLRAPVLLQRYLGHLSGGLGRPVRMSTDSIDQELSSHDRGTVEAADRVWQRIAREHGHFEDWNAVGEALMVGRQYAMRAVHIQQPRGKGYNDLFGRWRNRHFPEMSPVTCSNLLFLAEPENRMIVDELRRAMSDTGRMQVTHPDTMAKRVRQHLKQLSSPAKPEKRISQLEKCKIEVAELKRRLAHVGDGSLFDFQNDTVENIAAVMVGTSLSRAKQIAQAVLRRLQKAAG